MSGRVDVGTTVGDKGGVTGETTESGKVGVDETKSEGPVPRLLPVTQTVWIYMGTVWKEYSKRVFRSPLSPWLRVVGDDGVSFE